MGEAVKRSALKSTKLLERKTPLRTRTPFARSSSLERNTKPKAPKTRKCANRACGERYLPDPKQLFKNWCSEECGTVLALAKLDKQKAARASAARKERKVALERLKTRIDYLKEAQAAFNAYIRERDTGKPCICCGRFPQSDHVTGGTWDAGHYRSVGSAPHLRFHEDNVHRQLKQCNQWGAGRAVDYRIGLIARIGIERVESLEADQEPRKWSIDELKGIRNEYRQKLRELRNSMKAIDTQCSIEKFNVVGVC